MAVIKSQKDTWQVMNLTDGILASPAEMTKQEAENFIARFPTKYSSQGYYLTANGIKIKPEEVQLKIIPAGE